MALGDWKTKPPMTSGDYWFKGRLRDSSEMAEPIIVHVFARDKEFYLAGDAYVYRPNDFSGLWTGPLLPPELPSQ